MIHSPPCSTLSVLPLSFLHGLLLLLTIIPPISAQESGSGQLVWNIDLLASVHGTHDVELSPDQQAIVLRTTGKDPYFWFDLPQLRAQKRDWILCFEYFCTEGIRGIHWRVGKPARPDQYIEFPDLPPAEGWSIYTVNLTAEAPNSIQPGERVPIRIDLGSQANVVLQLKSVSIRPMTDQELAEQRLAERQRAAKLELAGRIQAYTTRVWAASLERVEKTDRVLRVKGKVNSIDPKSSVYLINRHDASVAANPPTAPELARKWLVRNFSSDGSFQIEIPVTSDALTRLGSRWQLFQIHPNSVGQSTTTAISSARYSSILPRYPQLEPLQTPQAAKGLTCLGARFDSEQLRELGLRHGSINVLLDGLLSDEEAPGFHRWEYTGRTWWANSSRLRTLDADVRTATDAGLQVAAILLIPNRGQDSVLAHPEANATGVYAMPNLTEADSTERYAATLHLLGERYSGAHESYGRIDHWIVHNEIDYGWQWTNMGTQPMVIYMEHYTRSLRLVDGATRSYNPHARAFISLTHRWNAEDCQPWKTYAPLAMLRWLVRSSRCEGDFPWGVAYHPYPQSLWKADTWNDTQPTDQMDTPLITLKNLEVLDRFMHLPENLTAQGAVRPVICSEQGFHASATSPNELEIQSAALIYTWQKLRQCPSILAFDYHRPVDHPNEGGLLLGLRGLPSREHPLGKPKPAWETYRAIGTPHEPQLIEKYRKLWEADE